MASISTAQRNLLKMLYYKKGLSAREIAERLEVGIDAVYYCMRKAGLARRDRAACNKLLFLRKPPTYHIPRRFSKEGELLRTLGVSLYWCEGAKRGTNVDFANSDAQMCRLFIRFLREVCGVDEKKLRAFLYCHDNQVPEKLINFWSRVLQLPKAQFTKSYVRKYVVERGGIKQRPTRMEYGLIHIRYSDLKLLNQIKEWIEEYAAMGR